MARPDLVKWVRNISLWVLSSKRVRRKFLVLGSLFFLAMSALKFHGFGNWLFSLNLQSMDRIIGIDFGRARTGLAVSDPLGVFASALDTVHSANIIDYIKKYAEKERVVRFVVGYPKNLNGKPSEAASDVDAFLKKLSAAFPDIPVTLEDERFTSVLAHKAMIDGGMKKSDRRNKANVDKISAAIILQGYLDRCGGTGFAAPKDSPSPEKEGKDEGGGN